MRDRSQPAGNETAQGAAQPLGKNREAMMKSIIKSGLLVVALAGVCAAKEPLPEAPSAVMAGAGGFILEAPVAPAPAPKIAESKIVDSKFVSLAIISTGSTMADSYTTLFARENFLAGKKGVCNMETQSAYLYGTHPSVGRAYAVASVKSAASVFAAYYMRKHHSKFWSLPLIANSTISLEGVTQNLAACN
jgi:hypothetical protein